MRYPLGMTPDECEALSRGFDAGNYGNAYESTDWDTWWEDHAEEWHTNVYRDGALLGFFSSSSLDEISDEELRDDVRSLRAVHDYEACAACGGSLPDDLLRMPHETRNRHCGAECPSGNPS